MTDTSLAASTPLGHVARPHSPEDFERAFGDAAVVALKTAVESTMALYNQKLPSVIILIKRVSNRDTVDLYAVNDAGEGNFSGSECSLGVRSEFVCKAIAEFRDAYPGHGPAIVFEWGSSGWSFMSDHSTPFQ